MGHPVPKDADRQSLGESLGPALMEHTGGRLCDIEWFRSTWQRGGSATGFATWKFDSGREQPVIVKLPVKPNEHRWTTRLGAADGDDWESPESCERCTPRVVAAGLEVGGYDLAWVVIERLQGHLEPTELSKQDVQAMVQTAAEFQACAQREHAPQGPGPKSDWGQLIERGREVLRVGDVPESQRWNEALKHVQKALPKLIGLWMARPINAWCHGDLHPGNLMIRSGSRPRPVLVDFGLVHAGHWLEDGLYLERQFWGRKEMLCGVKPVSAIAKYRKELGLCIDEGYPELANLRRVLMAACVPSMFGREGDSVYVHGALEVLEGLWPRVCR